VYSHVKETKK